MPAVGNATPLLALDAVAVDSETTGLDPKQARIVEIAAVRLVHGRVMPEANFRRLVRPGVPIPAAVTKVHGIDDAAVAIGAGFCRDLAAMDSVRRRCLVGRAHARLRSRGAQAGMRARGSAVDAPARPRHPAAWPN